MTSCFLYILIVSLIICELLYIIFQEDFYSLKKILSPIFL